MTGCAPFDQFCSSLNEQAIPASPITVAKFVAAHAAMGIESIWSMIGAISRAHYLIGLADPTLGGQVSAAINAIAKIDPPPNWPEALKARFQTLPYDMQAFLAMKAKDDRRVISLAQQEAAESRKKLAVFEQPAKVNDGIHEATAA